MSGSLSETARLSAVDQQTRQAQSEEYAPNFVLQSLMIDDRNLRFILTGQIQEPLSQLKQMVMDFGALDKIDKGHSALILELLGKINSNLTRFRRLTPYMLLTSHLMRLTYLTEKDAKILKRRVSIMIRRDILDIDEEELELTDINFYESIKILCFNGIDDSIQGFKLRNLTEQKKTITNEFKETRKKRWGIF